MSKTMTNERAIEALKELEWLKNNYALSDRLLSEDTIKMAIQALEYRTPKKPNYDKETGAYYCPSCQRSQAYAVDDFGDYCELCGQAIDKSLDRSDEE